MKAIANDCERLITSEKKLPGEDSNLHKENQNLLCGNPKLLPVNTSGKPSRRRDRALTKPTLKVAFSNPPEPSQVDPDLAQIVAAWPALPEHVRLAVLALVETARM